MATQGQEVIERLKKLPEQIEAGNVRKTYVCTKCHSRMRPAPSGRPVCDHCLVELIRNN